MDVSLDKSVLIDISKIHLLHADGRNYKYWSQKLLIFSKQLEVNFVLFNPPPLILLEAGEEAVGKATKELENYEKCNRFVRGHLLSKMCSDLFNIYVDNKSSKSIWEALEKTFGIDDPRNRRYFMNEWLQFQLVDTKPIIEQIHEYEYIVANLLIEGMEICETLQANALIEKLSPSWIDFKNNLLNKEKDFTLQELISLIEIEVANLLEVNNKVKWMLDTGANRHCCGNKELIHEFKDVTDDGLVACLGDSTKTSKVCGKGKIYLKFTHGKTLILEDVYYVPSFDDYFISASQLTKLGLKIVFEDDKVIITENGEFVGKGYLDNDHLFFLHTL